MDATLPLASDTSLRAFSRLIEGFTGFSVVFLECDGHYLVLLKPVLGTFMREPFV